MPREIVRGALEVVDHAADLLREALDPRRQRAVEPVRAAFVRRERGPAVAQWVAEQRGGGLGHFAPLRSVSS